MRLDNQQKIALQEAIKNVPGPIYLFGSRVDENKKGGDVDLLVFSEESPYKLSITLAAAYFMKCEEKIDVVVFNPKRLTETQRAFLNVIKRERIK